MSKTSEFTIGKTVKNVEHQAGTIIFTFTDDSTLSVLARENWKGACLEFRRVDPSVPEAVA